MADVKQRMIDIVNSVPDDYFDGLKDFLFGDDPDDPNGSREKWKKVRLLKAYLSSMKHKIWGKMISAWYKPL